MTGACPNPAQGSRPQTPGPHTPKTPHTPASSNYSSYSAFSGSPLAARLPPVHLSTTGRGELLRWVNDVLDMDLSDISDVSARLHFRARPCKHFRARFVSF